MPNEKQNMVEMMERERVPVTIETLPENEKLLFDGISRIYFYAIVKNPILLACVNNMGGLNEPADIEDACKKFMLVKKKLETVSNKIYIKKDNLIIDADSSSATFVSLKNNATALIDQAIDFVQTARKIRNFEDLNSNKHFNALYKDIKTLQAIMSKTRTALKEWNLLSVDSSATDVFETAYGDFSLSVTAIRELIKNHFRQQNATPATVVQKPVRKVESTINPAEQKRQDAIKQANDKYEEFCLDFMRDLEKQYALSSRDLYENFINVRFKKFVERYPMPVPSSASEGYAREVINQINILIEHVSKISQNSYVTSVYKEMQ